jgi:hypothetical protein
VSKPGLARCIAIGGSLLAAAGCTPVAQRPPVAGLPFTACVTHERDAVGGGRILVEICAAPDAHTIGGGNAGAGKVVAQMTNLDAAKQEARWELEPLQRYFVIVSRGNRFQIVGPGNGDNARRSGEYHRCVPHWTPPTTSAAHFGTCQDRGHATAASPAGVVAEKGGPSDKGGRSDEPMRASLSPYDGPAWISCPTGCCTTEAQ